MTRVACAFVIATAALLAAPAGFTQRAVSTGRLLALVGDTHPVLDGASNLKSGFGMRLDPATGRPAFHEGVDLDAPTGAVVHAPAKAVVSFAGIQGAWGQVVELDFGNEAKIRFAHLNDIRVSAGDAVEPGTVIGLVGTLGRTVEEGLHVEYDIRGKLYDPSTVRKLEFGAVR